jgi:hypothetical protein
MLYDEPKCFKDCLVWEMQVQGQTNSHIFKNRHSFILCYVTHSINGMKVTKTPLYIDKETT